MVIETDAERQLRVRMDVVRALREEEWPEVSVGEVVRLPESYVGETYLVSISSGALVLKYRAARRPLAVSRSAMRLLSQHGCSVQPIVIPLRQTSGGWLLGIQWLKGCPLGSESLARLSGVERQRVGRELASWLAAMHAFAAPANKPATDWLDKANRRIVRKIDQARALGALSSRDAATVDLCWKRLNPALLGVRECLVHRDLHPANILLLEGGPMSVIDFEYACLADPFYDLVKVCDYVLPLDADVARGFAAACGINQWTEDERTRFRAARMLEYLSAVVYFSRRGESESAHDRLGWLMSTCTDDGIPDILPSCVK